MGLCEDVRRHCAAIAEQARWVTIDPERIGDLEPGPPPSLDPEVHYLGGSREEVAAYLLTLGAINFGSGWFPTLRKRAGRSGYNTIASALTEHFRAHGPWSTSQLRGLDGTTIAGALGQEPDHELMGLYARGLNDFGRFLGGRSPLDVIDQAEGSAERLAAALAHGMPFFDDRGFYKRAQITANDVALAGIVEFDDLDRLTIFADNVVPHVLRIDGVLRYEPELAARIDAGDLIEPGSSEEVEVRASAVRAGELIAAELGVQPRILDTWLWNRGQLPRYKALPRHRTRTVFY